jgi:hypothetical protein
MFQQVIQFPYVIHQLGKGLLLRPVAPGMATATPFAFSGWGYAYLLIGMHILSWFLNIVIAYWYILQYGIHGLVQLIIQSGETNDIPHYIPQLPHYIPPIVSPLRCPLYHWIGLRENRNWKPWVLPANIEVSSKLSPKPIHYIPVWLVFHFSILVDKIHHYIH